MRKILLSGFLAILINGCANVVAPSGGDKDALPPVLIGATPPNQSTQFNSNIIELKFDEYVKVKDAFSNVLVSPPMSEPPKIYPKKKGLVIELPPDTLLSNTTYTINFGNSIVDLNEANPLPGFKYVFSTGDYVDSLAIRGKVISSETGKPQEDHFVVLYDDLSDTAFHTSKPRYFTRTNEEGLFEITNIKTGKYNLFSLEDKNLNYYYDYRQEVIGFAQLAISIIETDSAIHRLFTFTEQDTLERISKAYSPHAGMGIVRINRSEHFDSLVIGPGYYHTGLKEDSIRIYSKAKQNDSLQIIALFNNAAPDTAILELKKFPHDSIKTVIKVKSSPAPGVISPFDPIVLSSALPISGLLPNMIRLHQDSVPNVINYPFRAINTGDTIKYDWEYGATYYLTIDSGAYHDHLDQTNDSTAFRYQVLTKEEYADLKLTVKHFADGSNYVLLIKNSRGEVVKESLLEKEESTVHLSKILPGNYHLEVIQDRNKNGKWDTGNLARKIQPEFIYKSKEPVSLRANWEVESVFDLTAEDP
jgi:uncharacterized protein (DUF2141 family)